MIAYDGVERGDEEGRTGSQELTRAPRLYFKNPTRHSTKSHAGKTLETCISWVGLFVVGKEIAG